MKNIKPLPITPTTGGTIKTENVVCRDEKIIHYWLVLVIKSISLFAERRFGKSSVIKKMDENPDERFVTMYKSIQSINSIDELVDTLFTKAKEKKLLNKAILKEIDKVWNKIAELFPEILGVKLGKSQLIWQKKLIYLIDSIHKSNPNKILVIFLDEYSLMLDAMKTEDAATIIGFLRDIEHDTFSENLRFVFTGSISIDLVLNKIKLAGHNLGDPLNHTERERLEPFDLEQTIFFCECLELGCNIEINDSLKKYIYTITNGIPYFIDRIVHNIRYTENITKATVNNALDLAINDPDDKNNLAYYYDRIEEYYPDADLSYEILQIVCKNENIEESEIVNAINNKLERKERIIQKELERLWNDGYFKRENKNGHRKYSFQYNIIKKWWTANKVTI